MEEQNARTREKLKQKTTAASTKLTYQSKINILANWLRTHYPDCINEKQINIPLDGEAILNFASICDKATCLDECDDLAIEETTIVPLSVSSVVGYRSALVDLYKRAKVNLDPDVDKDLNFVLDGYERLINSLKTRERMKVKEGKSHLRFGGYVLFAKKLLTLSPTEKVHSWGSSTFSWCYFVVMWNLTNRTDSVGSIMMQHVDWSEDCLVIEGQGHKGDQHGAEKYGKHVYANPFQPEICPILSLAVLFFNSPPSTHFNWRPATLSRHQQLEPISEDFANNTAPA